MIDIDYAPDDPRPHILIVADDRLGEQRAHEAIAAAGGEALVIALDGAAERIAVEDPDAVIVSVQADPGAALDALLDALERAAAAGRFRSVVVLPRTLIDTALALAPHPDVMLLCEPDVITEATALALALAGRAAADRAREEMPGALLDLHRLSEEAARIARSLSTLAGQGRAVTPPSGAAPAARTPPDAPAIRRMLRERRMRDRFFAADLFADPAWDILLDLMAARLERNPVGVSSLCIAAAVPPTTALRWIKSLTTAGLLERLPDPGDDRRVFVGLTEQAADAMAGYLTAIGGVR